MKGRILADFLVEKPDDALPEASVIETPQEPWTLFMNGSSCVDGSGAGLILTSLEGTKFTYALRFQFVAPNNEAAYEALIVGLRITAQMGVRNVQLCSLYQKQVLVEILKEKSIQEKEVAAVIEEEGPTWMTPIIEYLRDETLPDDRKEASKLRIKARQYELLDWILSRRSFLKPWLRCVGPLQADYVIREIHKGSCSMHARPRSVVAKAMRSRYYWPTMHQDARDMIGKCKGIDIAGPFPKGPGKVKFLIVAMDYFTKWIEAKAVATISGSQVKNFVWDNICEKLNIVHRFTSVKHPQSNRLVERENRSLGEGNKNWLEELPHVFWAHLTMIKSSNNDTLFSLTYGTEAIIPAEIGMPTHRTAVGDAVYNDEELHLNRDLLEERRERAAIREAKANNDASHAVDGGKLGLKWEGPYEVTEALGDGAYKLSYTDGMVLPRTWNIANLKKCYL
ncbi:reverse transcriptase domain-containing protein [Tanacetum coccineum]